MLKRKWIPTPLVLDRQRPTITPISRPSRLRPLTVALVVGGALLRLLWRRVIRRGTAHEQALLIRRTLERLGGVWVKVGQLLGMRRDLFSPEFCDVLSSLQDRATGFDFSYTRATIEEDFGRPLEAIFSDFEETPFAAASIGQIHRAVLRSKGVAVAVKIRRPGIVEAMRGDIRFVTAVCSFAVRVGFYPPFRWHDFQRELDRTLSEELNYRFEATAIRDMRRNLKRHGVYAPKVFRDFVSGRVLVMEFVQGALMSDVLRLRNEDPDRLRAWLTENQIEERVVGRRLWMSLSRQLFEDNYFHGDLHPGNIVLLRKSRIALIDFGSVGWLEADFLVQYNEMQRALGRQQYAKSADLFLLLGPELPPAGLEDCKAELVSFMRGWALRARTKGLPFSEKSIGYAYSEMMTILTRYRVPATWAFLRVNRAQLTLDTSLRALYPGMDYFKLMRRYNEQAGERKRRAALNPEAVMGQVASMALELPALVRGAVEESFYNVEWVRRRARTIQNTATKAAVMGEMVVNALGFWMLLTVVAGVLLFSHQHGRWIPMSADLQAMFDRVPLLPTELWVALLAFALTTLFGVWRGRRAISAPDMPPSGVGR